MSDGEEKGNEEREVLFFSYDITWAAQRGSWGLFAVFIPYILLVLC